MSFKSNVEAENNIFSLKRLIKPKVTYKEQFTRVENSIGNDLVMVLTALAFI